MAHTTRDDARSLFEEVCLPHRATLYRVALRWTRDADEAEDAVQDALTTAYRRFNTFRLDRDGNADADAARGRAWLRAILLNHLRNRYRARRDGPPPVSLDDWDGVASPDRDAACPERVVLRRAEADAAMAALRRLPPMYGDLLAMVGGEPRATSYEEIARKTGLPVGTVRSRIFRARARLRQKLTAEGIC